jgi:hypothetical protein
VHCNNNVDNNEHFGLCTAHKDICIDILRRHLVILFNIIKDHAKGLTNGLLDTIQSSQMFNTSFSNSISKQHSLYLLIHHLVLADLTVIFYNYLLKKLRFQAFLTFMNSIMSDINSLIWNKRSILFK